MAEKRMGVDIDGNEVTDKMALDMVRTLIALYEDQYSVKYECEISIKKNKIFL